MNHNVIMKSYTDTCSCWAVVVTNHCPQAVITSLVDLLALQLWGRLLVRGTPNSMSNSLTRAARCPLADLVVD